MRAHGGDTTNKTVLYSWMYRTSSNKLQGDVLKTSPRKRGHVERDTKKKTVLYSWMYKTNSNGLWGNVLKTLPRKQGHGQMMFHYWMWYLGTIGLQWNVFKIWPRKQDVFLKSILPANPCILCCDLWQRTRIGKMQLQRTLCIKIEPPTKKQKNVMFSTFIIYF